MRRITVNKKLRSPIQWFGGKGQIKSRITPLLERIPHKRYCEPFGGGASILLSKDPVELETYNDLDGGLYDLFTVLADPETFEQFYRRVALLPYSRELYNEHRATWRGEDDRVKRVAKWFVMQRQSFAGRPVAGHKKTYYGDTVAQGTLQTKKFMKPYKVDGILSDGKRGRVIAIDADGKPLLKPFYYVYLRIHAQSPDGALRQTASIYLYSLNGAAPSRLQEALNSGALTIAQLVAAFVSGGYDAVNALKAPYKDAD